MKKIFLSTLFLLFTLHPFAQLQIPITPAGRQLKQFYLKQDVTHLWIAGHHINWETGESDMPEATKSIKTHCSAFVASVCEQLHIYILRPPEHVQGLLANAQYAWLFTRQAKNESWRQITENALIKAQEFANEGFVVIAVSRNTDASKPGHIALVIPAEQASDSLQSRGPVLIQASDINSDSTSFRRAFRRHLTEWPPVSDAVAFFYNILKAAGK